MHFALFLDQFWGGETEENLIDMVAGMSIALNLAKIAPESFENQSLDVQTVTGPVSHGRTRHLKSVFGYHFDCWG